MLGTPAALGRRCAAGCPGPAAATHSHTRARALRAGALLQPRRRVAVRTAAAVAEAPGAPPQPAHTTLPAPEAGHLINNNRGFVEGHRMRGYEVGPDQHTSFVTIANILQEVASNHAVAMWGRSEEGFASDPSLAEDGLIFVMTRLQLQMDAYPRWGDVARVETWFMPSGKIGAQRDWLLSCRNTGRPLGRATSSWVMINLRTRRLAKVPEAFREKCMGFVDEGRHAIPPAATKHKLPDLALPAEIVGPAQVARRSDIDMNGHVNNVTYMDWALETVPADVYDTMQLYQVEVDFKAECHAGDLVESLAQRTPAPEGLATNGTGPQAQAFVHLLRRCEGERCTELVRMRTVWVPRGAE